MKDEMINKLDKNYIESRILPGYEGVCKEIEFIEGFIPEFFSKNGEANNIKIMYEKLDEINKSDESKEVSCVDVNKGFHIYKEYVEGMLKFINDIKNVDMLTESRDFENYSSQFNQAKRKDALFIDAIYGGNINQSVNTNVTEAVSNIEFLIEFIPELKILKEYCDTLHNSSINSNDTTKEKLFNESSEMFYESVGYYIHSTVKNVLSTFCDINDKLNEEIVTTESVKDNFKLFI